MNKWENNCNGKERKGEVRGWAMARMYGYMKDNYLQYHKSRKWYANGGELFRA